ncbi:hypothetical protein [Actinomadura sp. WMMB 499]|uniref:hypothetical protein n=1 Tax=Actinomadura sp. WMMB 499 TaxID=1219491 RepID=UPI0012448D8D|nr:hypothetical protein [Actinomadura sp. WMMB 499]QFG24673.1 hypothetical protein F7P10_29540 [Actinomadura sp. WMMB 499]
MKAEVVMNDRTWSPVPGYRGIIAVDAEGFSKRTDVSQEHMAGFIPEVLAESFRLADLEEVWAGREFPSHRGDGYAFGFDAGKMPGVIDPWLATLQKTLMASEPLSGGPLRLRVSLNIGPLRVDGGPHDGSGTARNDTHRLLNATVLKRLLAAASRDVTRVVAIVSDQCFEDVVRSGGRTLHPDHFCAVSATVREKQFARRAWVHVPTPSGNLLAAGITALLSGEDSADDVRVSSSQGAAHVFNHATGNLNNGEIGGDQSITFRA